MMTNPKENTEKIKTLCRQWGGSLFGVADLHSFKKEEILLPPSPGTGLFFKFRPQNNLDFATFTLSVLLPRSGGGSRIVVASVASRPLRARKAESILDQEAWDAEAVARKASEELQLVSFVRGAVEFKKQAIQAKLSDLLKSLRGRSPYYH